MRSIFLPNIDNKSCLIRGIGALPLLVGAGFGLTLSPWLGITLLGSGGFVAFEALHGWCALRACGIKTKP